jgi:hypothetical protein
MVNEKESIDKKILNQSSTQPSKYGIVNIFIYGILLFVLFLGLMMFMIYPTKLLLSSYVPFTIFYLLITFIILIYIIVYITKRNDNMRFIDFINTFRKHTVKLLIILGIFLAISVVMYFIFSGIKNFFTFLLGYSFWFPFGLVIILLSILNQYTSNYTFNNKYVNLIKNFILYIPCLLSDTIEYLKKDYKDTPSTVMILFVILMIYILLFFFIPIINQIIYSYDGLLLINKPLYLNTNVIVKTKTELMDDIFNSRPFYDRWTQEILNKTDLFNQASQLNNTDVSYNINKTFGSDEINYNKKYTIITDNLTNKFYESFTTAQGDDSLAVINSLNFLSQMQQNLIKSIMVENPDIKSKINELEKKPESLKEYILSIIYNNPQLMSIYDKIILILNNTKALGVAASGIPGDLTGSYTFENNLLGNLYHYGISFWVYINSNEIHGKQIIISYGNRPSLYYNGDTKELTLEINNIQNNRENNSKTNVIYKTNSILYQRWNHIVMNYNYGSFDLFINNNLVGSYKNIVPKLYDDDMLLVGSKNNSNLGGVCNMKYYELPIPLNKIEKIYSHFHNKNPPI